MDQSEHCKEVYAYAGLALYRAQCVEQSIIQLLIFFDFFQKNSSTFKSQADWEEKFDSYDAALSQKTMGKLIKNLTLLAVVEKGIEVLLGEALSTRNHLAHKFFVEHAMNFLSEHGRNTMIAELSSAIALFNKVEDVLNPITCSLCEKYGLTKEHLHEVELQLFAEANGDLDLP